jgi:hypothetical protein
MSFIDVRTRAEDEAAPKCSRTSFTVQGAGAASSALEDMARADVDDDGVERRAWVRDSRAWVATTAAGRTGRAHGGML